LRNAWAVRRFGEFCAREKSSVSTNKISEKMNEYNERKILSIAYITKPLAVSRVVVVVVVVANLESFAVNQL
jgi:hypothetical protein